MGHRVSIKPIPQMEAYYYDGDAPLFEDEDF